MKVSADLIKALGITLEVTGTHLSDPAVDLMLLDLAAYPEAQVQAALRRCCRELKGKLTLADILSRIDDGRPTPEEAWSMIPRDESVSVVWTTEMRDACAAAFSLISAGEYIPARMTFLERYRVLVQAARDARHPVQWETSLGTDKSGRELVILDAVQKGRISAQRAQELLPYHREEEGLNARLLAIAGEALKALPLLEEGKEVRAQLREKYLPKKATA